MSVRLLMLGLALILAAPAAANEETMRVNELAVTADKVELLDVLPNAFEERTRFPDPSGYVVRSYDAAGTEVAAREYPQPIADSLRNTPAVLDLKLPPAAGQVCWERGRDPNDASPLSTFRLHCVGYGNVTRPVVSRMVIYGTRIAMPIAPAPGPGRSVQRQPCGRAAVAAPTLGARNNVVAAVCADSSPLCDDPGPRRPPPRLTVEVPRAHDVDRALVLKIKLAANGVVGARGSIYIPGRPAASFPIGPFTRRLRAGVTTRVRVPVPPRARRLIKRAAKRGQETVAAVVSVARGTCEERRSRSTRRFTLVP